ncbi:hypothetical protein DENIS_4639 [Desulfonema ishimotonii]|uniref:SnoaL-like domain-containing protein n=1 Tax=Desulfonema ishimotonii TaxID=45657 RepID=A0A401G389_9BACT|nr:nuclear transport factor 2 family protein [Desulfonema ishimotonii]GBC63641.1 hypothetical protein DENIS_4639 [Desulfonema ishimotonii]
MTVPRIMVCLILFWMAAAGPALAQETEKDAEKTVMQEIKAVMETYKKAFKARDIDGLMALWSSRPDILLMGTGPGERYMGTEEIKHAYLRFFDNFDSEEGNITWMKISDNGDTAWFSVMGHFTSYYKNVKNEFALNHTGVLEKHEGKWLFVMRHFSGLVSAE